MRFINDYKKGVKQHATDFVEIHKYRKAVNKNVFAAINDGTFAMIKNLNQLGNLMEHEDRHVFLIDNLPSKLNKKGFHIPYTKQMDNNKSFNFMNYTEELGLEEIKMI